MNLPDRRRIGALALIVAGIGAFLVPFLLHGPALQASNGNGGGGTTPTTTPRTTGTTCTVNCVPQGCTGSSCSSGCTGISCNTGGGDGGGTGTCDEDSSPDPTHSDDSNHNGQQKHSELKSLKDDIDSTVTLIKTMGDENPAFHTTHTTDTDNHTVHTHDTDINTNHADHDSNGCAEDDDDTDE